MDPTKVVEWIGRASAVTILAAILVTGQMGMWVFGTTYNEVKTDRDKWESIALKGLKVVEDHTYPQGLKTQASPSQKTSPVTPEGVNARLRAAEKVLNNE